MFYTRQQMEDLEERTLAPYASLCKKTKGRQYLESEPEYRTRFQRDRDRILHTTAFRRLEYKTQVFFNYEGDYYRTRLTHTLEVAQIGRTIARALGANEDLTEAISLAHDLGHPPFGHSGERALARIMRDYDGFDHNKQSLRIVTFLEKRYPKFPGLNLNWEVLEGIVKHETEYDRSDALEYNPDLRGHLEAQITNAADEIAYTAHDLDDGLRSGMITTKMLENIELWEFVNQEINVKGSELNDLIRHQIIREILGLEISDIVHTTEEKIRQNSIRSVDDIQRLSYNLIGFSETMSRRNRQLKDFLYTKLYRQYRVVRMQEKAERVIKDLFDAYKKEPQTLPDHIHQLIDERGLERTICDYIAGMTDRYAIEEYNKLFDPSRLP